MSYLSKRREYSLDIIEKLQVLLSPIIELIEGKACIYATGSFGRLEAGSQSDLDLFIVSKVDAEGKNLLSNLDAILVKSELIKAVRELKLPDFDGDGKYLAHHSTADFLNHLGGQEDDYRNILTGRLLMLMEGLPLIGEDIFDEVVELVFEQYFQDQDHSEFMPAFLCNDILRLWRTFCVNYEFARNKKQRKAKVKNFKLKHSRMLTCYSAICFLLSKYISNGTVTIEDAKEMAKTTPLDRMEKISELMSTKNLSSVKHKLFEDYEIFLQLTDKPEEQLIEEFDRNWNTLSKSSYRFGDNMYAMLKEVGDDTRFMRLIVV